MKIWMLKGLRGLEPADEFAGEALRRIHLGDVVRVDYTRPRNAAHHRKFFALLKVVQEATGQWDTVEDLLLELKVRLGIVKEYVIRGSGEVVKIPGSIAFANMDQDEFSIFYEKALAELAVMAGGIDEDDLRSAVLDELS